jgi:hypothetical protein
MESITIIGLDELELNDEFITLFSSGGCENKIPT